MRIKELKKIAIFDKNQTNKIKGGSTDTVTIIIGDITAM